MLNAAWNFRGYKCSYADLKKPTDVKIVHKEERRALQMLLETCEGGRGRQRPAFLTALLAALDAGECASPAAAARLRETCPS